MLETDNLDAVPPWGLIYLQYVIVNNSTYDRI
jgi:hypothetical protein